MRIVYINFIYGKNKLNYTILYYKYRYFRQIANILVNIFLAELS